MRFVQSFLLTLSAVLHALAQSQGSGSAVVVTVTSSSSCTRPRQTVYVYTSNSSTYIVQDLGSASLCLPTSSSAALAPADVSANGQVSPGLGAQAISATEAVPCRSDTPWCAPTTVTAPAKSCQNDPAQALTTFSQRTITSYVLGKNGSCPSIPAPPSCPATDGTALLAPRTITSCIPATTSYVYRSGSQECGSSVVSAERTVTSYLAEASSCPPASNGTQLFVRTITSQMPAMTSYVYRSETGLTITVTDRASSDGGNLPRSGLAETASLGRSPDYLSDSGTPAPYSTDRSLSCPAVASVDVSTRTITSFIDNGANSSCPSVFSSSTQVLTSYIYGTNTTITIQAGASECASILGTSRFAGLSDSDSTAGALQSTLEVDSSSVPTQQPSDASLTSSPQQSGSISERTVTASAVLTETTTAASAILTETTTAISTALASDDVPADGDAPIPTPQPTVAPVVANASALQQQGVGSDPYVIAQVVSPQDNPPIVKEAGDSDFLLVTFGTTTSASSTPLSGKQTRQAAQPLVYNTTQYFSSVAGGIYNLSAVAAMAQNGDTPPSCALSICARGGCGEPQPIGTSFQPYYYIYNAQSTSSSDIATFSIRCAGPAYVGLDNVAVTTIYLPQTAGASRYVL